MEYRYAKWDEQPEQELIQRHEREIFPMTKRRHLFSDVKNFLLYDFFTPEGYVNENVFAYYNRHGDERTLVIYHNKYHSARGWVRSSVAYSGRNGEGEERTLIQKDLREGLGLHDDQAYFCIFRDHATGLEYIRNSKELSKKGLYVELDAYKYHVFTNFKEVRDNQWHHYAQIANSLNGRGIPSIEASLKEMLLQPLQDAFKELANADMFRHLMEARITQPQTQLHQELMEKIEKKMITLLRVVKQFSGGREDEMTIAREVRCKLEAILYLPIISSRYPRLQPKGVKAAAEYLYKGLTDSISTWAILFGWLFVHTLGKVTNPKDFAEQSRGWVDEWRLDKTISDVLKELGVDGTTSARALTLVLLLTGHQRWYEVKPLVQTETHTLLESLFRDGEVQQFLQVNQYNNIWWFNKESFEEFLWWLMLIAAVEIGKRFFVEPPYIIVLIH